MLSAGIVLAQENHSDTDTSASSQDADNKLFSQSFAQLDANGDGKISWPEAQASGMSQATFYSVETIEDDHISRAEYDAAVAAFPEGVVGKPVQKKGE